MILCCGEALIDMIPAPTVAGGEGFVPHSGGAIFNTAIALGRLGIPTGFLTGLSNDLFGAQLQEDLAKSHVDARFAIRSELPTTLAFVQLNDGHATYTFYDENSAGRSLTSDQLPVLPDEIEALYFGGISLIGEPGADFYADLAIRESATRTIMLDPNIRPGFINNEQHYRARLDRMVAVADIVKVSDEDLDWILPGSEALSEKARHLQSLGPKLAVVTRGSAGAVAFHSGTGEIKVPAPNADVVDTVGAGDTFNAGFLAHLAKADALSKDRISAVPADTVAAALRLGAAVAAITVSRAGANPPWAEELAVPPPTS
jgi:fructokinase